MEKDGLFDVYADGEYLYTTEDIEYFENNVKVYKSLEEAKEAQRK